MPDLGDVVSRLVPGAQHLPVPFVVLLLVHIPAGLACVVLGAVAAASPKRRGRHPAFGTAYYCGLAAVFVTASGMAALRWTEDRHLFVLGMLSFGVATAGYLARRVRWRGWTSFHAHLASDMLAVLRRLTGRPRTQAREVRSGLR